MSQSVGEVLRSHGAPLDSETRGFMESRFGHDFSRVRVHTDEQAAESARALSASAFTVGSHVVFDAGQFAPRTERGRFLLAHELAHVVQQGARDDAPPATFGVQPADAPWEREADLVARRVARGDAAVPAAGEAETKKRGPFMPARRWLSSLMRLPAGALQRQCQETNHATSAEHVIIQLWYKLRFPQYVLLREYAIPRSAADGATGYADLVSITNGGIWDIIGPGEQATSTQRAGGGMVPGRVQDTARYVRNANRYCTRPLLWRLGRVLTEPQNIPSASRPVLQVAQVWPGILQYSRPRPIEEHARETIQDLLRQLRESGVAVPYPNLDPPLPDRPAGATQTNTQEQESTRPTSTQPARAPALVELDPELAAYRDAAEQALRSPNLPAAESYLLLAPSDFYEQNVRAPRMAAAEAAVRGAYEVQGTRAAVNPVMGAHAMAVSLLGLHAALTAAGVAAITLGPSAIMMSGRGLAAALRGLTAARSSMSAAVATARSSMSAVTGAARSILAAMLNPRLVAPASGAVMYIATFREAQAAPGGVGERAADSAGELESLRVVTFAPEGAVRITHRSRSAGQSGVHAFYAGEHYMVVGRARRQAGAAPE